MNIFQPTDILLPTTDDMTRWSVVACDQYTSQKEYWDRVRNFTKGHPTTLDLIFPEAYLASADFDETVSSVNRAMQTYLSQNLFREYKNVFIYVRRTFASGLVRTGLLGAVDLEAYDYTPGSHSPIRATEATVLDRIPPRVTIRRHAPLELPHILLLADDPSNSIFNACTSVLPKESLYDFDLMESGGHIEGYLISDTAPVLSALSELSSDPLIAVGDGNHSLAGAKSCWEEKKKTLTDKEKEHHPMRYALCELINLHEESLVFEPIYRVFFDCDTSCLLDAMKDTKGTFRYTVPYACRKDRSEITFFSDCPVESGAVTDFLEKYKETHGGRIDYIHGADTAEALGTQEGNIVFFVKCLKKEDLFSTVNTYGALPKKTFSMGSAEEKRFYLEARKLV